MYFHTKVVIVVSMLLLCAGNIHPDCTRDVCLSMCAVGSQLILICDVPNLKRQILFYDPNNLEYARCILPFPTPHCISKHQNSNIVQDLSTNQTVLIIKSPNNTLLNGKWLCSHGSDGEKDSVDVIMTKCLQGNQSNNCWGFVVLAIFATGTIIAFLQGRFRRKIMKILRGLHSNFRTQFVMDFNDQQTTLIDKDKRTEGSITEAVNLGMKSNCSSGVLRKKDELCVSSKESETRICGITILESGQLVVVDLNARQIKVFSDKTFNFTEDLDMEPRGLTRMTGVRIAVTFAYEKKILLYDVTQLCVIKLCEFDLKNVGKPFQIGFHENCFVVEINEGKDGRIVILNDKCEPIHVIPNDDWELGYFTGNTFRLEFDVKKEEIYIAAIGKKKVFCVDFNGKIKWHVNIQSPRSMVVLPNTQTTTLLVASNRDSKIIKLISKKKTNSAEYDIELVQMVDKTHVELPDYMAYDCDKQLLYTEVANGNVSVYDIISQL